MQEWMIKPDDTAVDKGHEEHLALGVPWPLSHLSRQKRLRKLYFEKSYTGETLVAAVKDDDRLDSS